MTDDLTRGQQPLLAIALKHDAGEVPRIAATGKGEFAEQILRIALDRGVKVREDADLAQILAKLELDSPIPLEAFAAVAEILAYLYRAQGRLSQQQRPRR